MSETSNPDVKRESISNHQPDFDLCESPHYASLSELESSVFDISSKSDHALLPVGVGQEIKQFPSFNNVGRRFELGSGLSVIRGDVTLNPVSLFDKVAMIYRAMT